MFCDRASIQHQKVFVKQWLWCHLVYAISSASYWIIQLNNIINHPDNVQNTVYHKECLNVIMFFLMYDYWKDKWIKIRTKKERQKVKCSDWCSTWAGCILCLLIGRQLRRYVSSKTRRSRVPILHSLFPVTSPQWHTHQRYTTDRRTHPTRQ